MNINTFYDLIVAPYQNLILKYVPNRYGAHFVSSFIILLALSAITLGRYPIPLIIFGVLLAASKEVINYLHNKYGSGGDRVMFLPFVCSSLGSSLAVGLVYGWLL